LDLPELVDFTFLQLMVTLVHESVIEVD